MISYFILMLFQLLIYCWHGNEILLESMNVAKAIFNSNWIVTEDEIKKYLMLMMLRAQRPIRMTAGKFAFLSLETYMTVIIKS